MVELAKTDRSARRRRAVRDSLAPAGVTDDGAIWVGDTRRHMISNVLVVLVALTMHATAYHAERERDKTVNKNGNEIVSSVLFTGTSTRSLQYTLIL